MGARSRHHAGATVSGIFTAKRNTNQRHARSTTDPEAKLCQKGKGQPAKLYFMGHALIKNRHGLVVQANATAATGTAKREAALTMIDRHEPALKRPARLSPAWSR
jgi:hypothetical protein